MQSAFSCVPDLNRNCLWVACVFAGATHSLGAVNAHTTCSSPSCALVLPPGVGRNRISHHCPPGWPASERCKDRSSMESSTDPNQGLGRDFRKYHLPAWLIRRKYHTMWLMCWEEYTETTTKHIKKFDEFGEEHQEANLSIWFTRSWELMGLQDPISVKS